MIHRGDGGLPAGISRRQQAVRAAIPCNFKGLPPNKRMAQLHDLLTHSIIEPENLRFIEEEVALYRKIWNKRQAFMRFQVGANHLQQGAGPAPKP